MPDHVDFVAYFAQYAAHARDIPTSEKVIHLPTQTKKWHVTKGPFVHDKSKEIFEQKKYKRLVQAFDADPEVVRDWVSVFSFSFLPRDTEESGTMEEKLAKRAKREDIVDHRIFVCWISDSLHLSCLP
jgi:ribosomal protein S10